MWAEWALPRQLFHAVVAGDTISNMTLFVIHIDSGMWCRLTGNGKAKQAHTVTAARIYVRVNCDTYIHETHLSVAGADLLLFSCEERQCYTILLGNRARRHEHP